MRQVIYSTGRKSRGCAIRSNPEDISGPFDLKFRLHLPNLQSKKEKCPLFCSKQKDTFAEDWKTKSEVMEPEDEIS